MDRTLALVFGSMFAGQFLAFLGGGFHGLNAFDLAGTGTAAIVFLSQAAWPQGWAFAARRIAVARSGEKARPATDA